MKATPIEQDLANMSNAGLEIETAATPKSTSKKVVMEKTIDLGGLTIVGFDPGSSENKCAVGEDPEDKTQVVCVPNRLLKVDVNEVSGLTRNMGTDFSFDEYDDFMPQGEGGFNVLDNIYFRYGAHGYLAGKAAADRHASLDIPESKVDNLVEKLIAACIALNIQGDIALAVAIRHKNQADYAVERQRAIEMLLNKPINFIYLDESYTVTPKHVFIQPEGLAAVNECQSQGIQFVGKTTAIIDIGELSTDGSLVTSDESGKGLSFNRVASCSLEFAMKQFAETVARSENLPSSESYGLLKAIASESDSYRYKTSSGIKRLNLQKILPTYKDGFSKQLREHILNWLPVEDIDQIVFVGGGSSCFWDELSNYFERESGIPTHTVEYPRLATALSLYNFAKNRVARTLAKGR